MNKRELPAEDLFLTNDYSVQVTLAGDGFDPAKATEIIGVEPTQTGQQGEIRHPDAGDDARWEQSFWSREINSRDDVNECRDHHISCLIDEIAPHVETLKSEAGMDRIYFYYTLASSIGLMNIKLSPKTMEGLSGIGADLYISCFDCFDPNHSFWSESISEKA